MFRELKTAKDIEVSKLMNYIERDSTGNTKIRDNYGNTAFLYVIREGTYKLFEKFLGANGNNCNELNYNHDTALHIAVTRGNYDMVKALLQIGANPNLTNREGKTAIHYSIFYGDEYCLELITKFSEVRIKFVNMYMNQVDGNYLEILRDYSGKLLF